MSSIRNITAKLKASLGSQTQYMSCFCFGLRFQNVRYIVLGRLCVNLSKLTRTRCRHRRWRWRLTQTVPLQGFTITRRSSIQGSYVLCGASWALRQPAVVASYRNGQIWSLPAYHKVVHAVLELFKHAREKENRIVGSWNHYVWGVCSVVGSLRLLCLS